MITVINKTNKGLYNELFEQVQNWLYTHNAGGEEVDAFSENALLRYVQVFNAETQEWVDTDEPETITSLEELFTNMEFITRFAPIYTRLPLDEEPFFIDANKRTISVPKDFASNGVSVQGDEIAEVLFFKINRFFDATDLSTCKIFIQWKSSEIDEETGKPKEGVSRPWIEDIVSEPGYLIFGWPISSKITKAPGPITFSVRFYRLDNADKLIYSFSTLDQTVTVKPALDYDIEDIVGDTEFIDDTEALIKGRAINSPNTASDVEALIPDWEPGILTALYNPSYVYATVERDNGNWKLAHLGIRDEFSSEPITMIIAATSDDSGVVSYKWSKVDGNSNQLDEYMKDGETPYYQVVAYIEDATTESERKSNKTYYYKEAQGDRYRAIPSSTSLDDARAEYGTVYQLVSIAIADEIGKYIGTARNRVGKVFSEDLSTDAIIFLKPAAPEIGELEVTNGAILDDQNDVVLSLASVVLNDELGKNPTAQGCKDTYVWHRRELGAENASDLEFTTEALTLSNPDTDEGWYSVTVTNNLNNEVASTSSEEVRVTKPANKVVLTTDLAREISATQARENGLHVYVANLEDASTRTEDDTVTFQWYEYHSDGGVSRDDIAAASEGTYEPHGDQSMADIITDDERVITSSTTDTFIPPANEDGYYYCLVTNTYNGTSKSVASPFYYVTM